MIKIFILAISLCMVMPTPTHTLINSLREGGYILYVRHGEATVGSDQEEINFMDCSTQRNLSEEGKGQAVSYGKALRRLGIPIQFPVIASPYCRARETAELAFGERNVQLDPFWVTIHKLSGDTPPPNQESTLAALTSILETLPPAGKNKVIIAHNFPMGIALGEIPYMGTVILRPRGQGNGYEVVGRLSLADFMSNLQGQALQLQF